MKRGTRLTLTGRRGCQGLVGGGWGVVVRKVRGTWLRRRLPPPTDRRASDAEGEGRAMAERKSVAEGGARGMECLGRGW
jgi:hypothetical protein